MPSSSLFLRSSTTFISVLSLASVSVSSVIPSVNTFGAGDTYYALESDYSGDKFLDGFTFNSDADLTHGFVSYIDKDTAIKTGLVGFEGGSVQLRADSSHKYDGNADYWLKNGVGRPSLRIESTDRWTHGLFIVDLKHVPTTSTTQGCGTWPAFWTLGDGEWPNNGEIDIFEGANNQGTGLSALHTGKQFTVKQSPNEQTGTPNGNDCQYYAGQANANGAGCASFDKRSSSYGPGMNAAGGGVYAMEWKSDAIKIWFFPRSEIPSDISSGSPEPDTWGLPSSIFNGPDADIDANFKNNQVIFDNTFCGDFGDATWNNGCSAITGQAKCSVFVGENPQEFSETYWDISYLRVYQLTERPPQTTTTSTTTTTTTTTSDITTTTSAPTSYTMPTFSTTSASQPTTSSGPGAQPSSTTSSWSHPGFPGTSSSSYSFGGHPSSSTTTKPSSPTGTTSDGQPWEDWTSSTSSKPVDPVTTKSTSSSDYIWSDWVSTTSSKHVDPAKTTSTSADYVWSDWISSSTSNKPVDPAKTTSADYVWSDWVASSSTTKQVDPAKTTSTSADYVWSDWVSSSSTTKPVAPATTTPAGNQGGWGGAAPTATVATTYTVAPVQSSVTAVAPVQSYTGTGVKPAVATYTGAAGRTQLSSFALGAAGIMAGAVLAF